MATTTFPDDLKIRFNDLISKLLENPQLLRDPRIQQALETFVETIAQSEITLAIPPVVNADIGDRFHFLVEELRRMPHLMRQPAMRQAIRRLWEYLAGVDSLILMGGAARKM